MKATAGTLLVRGEDWQDKFLSALAETGNVFRSCRVANVGRNTVYTRRSEDKEFSDRWRLALEDFADEFEAIAVELARNGWENDVFFQGRAIPGGKRRDYSAQLIIAVLKAKKPDEYGREAALEAFATAQDKAREIREAANAMREVAPPALDTPA